MTRPATLASLILHSFHPLAVARLSICFFFVLLSLSLSFISSRSQSLIHRDTGLIVSLVASMVDVTDRTTITMWIRAVATSRRLFYLFLLVHSGSLSLYLSFSLWIILAARSLRLMKRQADGDFVHCAAIIPVTRDIPGKDSRMKS